ncbi:MAG: hypothetical protein V9E85_14670 [Candidatus Nanopelagicales bacterium]
MGPGAPRDDDSMVGGESGGASPAARQRITSGALRHCVGPGAPRDDDSMVGGESGGASPAARQRITSGALRHCVGPGAPRDDDSVVGYLLPSQELSLAVALIAAFDLDLPMPRS